MPNDDGEIWHAFLGGVRKLLFRDPPDRGRHRPRARRDSQDQVMWTSFPCFFPWVVVRLPLMCVCVYVWV
jgi:hypothetical protein